MKPPLIKTCKKLQKSLAAVKKKKKPICFVPTMGYLHDGHLQCIRSARKKGGVVLVSIFVNPLQFGPTEDFGKYPRNLSKDLKLLAKEKVDLIFTPSIEEMYSKNNSVYIYEDDSSKLWCGKYRPGHFLGVLTVVSKFFNLIQPDYAFFGQKDFQQLFLIQKMCSNLFMPVHIKKVPTVREAEGLALSSRNKYLDLKQRKTALGLYRALEAAQLCYSQGIKNVNQIRNKMKLVLRKFPGLKIQYIGFASQNDLKPVKHLKKGDAVLIAGFVGKTRLIDNWIAGEKL